MLVPVLLHGAYDYIASSSMSVLVFVVFVAVLFAVPYGFVGKMSREDQFL